jgi:hypothetical protein
MFGPHAAKRKIDFAIIEKQFSSNGKIRYDTIYVVFVKPVLYLIPKYMSVKQQASIAYHRLK